MASLPADCFVTTSMSLLLCLQHCWSLSQPMFYLYKTLSSLNKINYKTYIAFKGNKVQFQDTEVLEQSSYFRLIEGEPLSIAQTGKRICTNLTDVKLHFASLLSLVGGCNSAKSDDFPVVLLCEQAIILCMFLLNQCPFLELLSLLLCRFRSWEVRGVKWYIYSLLTCLSHKRQFFCHVSEDRFTGYFPFLLTLYQSLFHMPKDKS